MNIVVAALHIYVDGSCEENRNVTADTPAGWGFCVVEGDTGLGRGRGEIVTEGSGQVITDEGSDAFIGAEIGSNNTAELSAIAGALVWLLQQGGRSSVVIRADSQYALNIANGQWRAKKNRDLASHVAHCGMRSPFCGNYLVNTSEHIVGIVGMNVRII